MRRLCNILMMTTMLSLSLTARSQIDAISMTLMPEVPYGNLYNPALPVSSNIFVGIGISNINMSLYNSSIRYNNIYNYENGKPVSIDATKLINSLDEHGNFISTDLSLDLFRFGFRIKKFFFEMDWKARYNAEFRYSRDFLGFFINGNGNYMGDNYADFSMGIDMSLTSEIAFGVQYEVNDKLTIAFRPKLVCGVANISVDDDETKIYTDENNYDMIADVNVNVKTSLLLDLDIDRIGNLAEVDLTQYDMTDVFRLMDNFGFGVDFGASYVFNKHFGVAAGVYDLGFIKWKNVKESHQRKDNVIVNDALCDNYKDLMSLKLDFGSMLKDMVNDVMGEGELTVGKDYKTMLKTRIMLQGYCELNPMMRFTALSQLYYVNKKMTPSITLAYSGSFFNILNLTTSYTISKYSGNSVSAGMALCLGPVKFYAVSDNIMLFSKLSQTTVEMLTSYEMLNFRLGIVLSFGSK